MELTIDRTLDWTNSLKSFGVTPGVAEGVVASQQRSRICYANISLTGQNKNLPRRSPCSEHVPRHPSLLQAWGFQYLQMRYRRTVASVSQTTIREKSRIS